MNKSKILLACAVIVFSFCVTTLSLAKDKFVAPSSSGSYFNGAYLGVGGGIVHALPEVNSTFYDGSNVIEESVTHDFKIGQYGFDANIFAGYGKTFSSPFFYLGGELFANCFSTKVKKGHVIYTYDWSSRQLELITLSTEVKNPYSFGSDIRAGYLISPRTMLYVLFGVDYAKFDVKNEAVPLGFWPNIRLPVTNEFDKWRLGYMPGIGVETCLRDNVSLRAQYTYTFYPSFSHSISFVDPYGQHGPAIVDLETKVKPQGNKFTVMLSFLFN